MIEWPRTMLALDGLLSLAQHPRGQVNLEGVETNMVYFGIEGWTDKRRSTIWRPTASTSDPERGDLPHGDSSARDR